MSQESRWYDEARMLRFSAREKNPELASEATEIAFATLNNLNADKRAKFWESMRKSILQTSEAAPDEDCKRAAQCLARICFKIGHAADGHPK